MWYFAHQGEQSGPFTEQGMRELIAAGQISSSDLVWREGMPDWQPISMTPEFAGSQFRGGPPPVPFLSIDNRRLTAGVLALVLGGFGIHKFYLGKNMAGVIKLLIALGTCGLGWIPIHAIAMAEGLIYLIKSDSQFYQDYVVGDRQWF